MPLPNRVAIAAIAITTPSRRLPLAASCWRLPAVVSSSAPLPDAVVICPGVMPNSSRWAASRRRRMAPIEERHKPLAGGKIERAVAARKALKRAVGVDRVEGGAGLGIDQDDDVLAAGFGAGQRAGMVAGAASVPSVTLST